MGGTDAPAGEQSFSLGSQEEEERCFLPPHQRHHQQLLSRSGHPVPRDFQHHCSSCADHSLKPGDRLHTARFSHHGLRPARRFGTTRAMFLFWKKTTGLRKVQESLQGLRF
ncbi:hypothetical protein OJAV_G00025200 [Oryzias javanicus]|uniref:Uncharacterized protein n=1 Tax=Oryzias javanicus TaxID=123683 RepID=A0A3S2PIV3_ORYJA|nr:hypothetical protein OJAV_G00025200 [Oryzias javanicus]